MMLVGETGKTQASLFRSFNHAREFNVRGQVQLTGAHQWIRFNLMRNVRPQRPAIALWRIELFTRKPIINREDDSSIDSLRPSAPGLGHYGASKAALNALTRSASVEYGPRGIRVNALLPGVILTDGTSGGPEEFRKAWADRSSARRIGTPEDIAAATLFLAGPLADFVHGHCLVADGGLTINA